MCLYLVYKPTRHCLVEGKKQQRQCLEPKSPLQPKCIWSRFQSYGGFETYENLAALCILLAEICNIFIGFGRIWMHIRFEFNHRIGHARRFIVNTIECEICNASNAVQCSGVTINRRQTVCVFFLRECTTKAAQNRPKFVRNTIEAKWKLRKSNHTIKLANPKQLHAKYASHSISEQAGIRLEALKLSEARI